jgi:regulator of protease activity HflC (stomatin/prohibitin superfamily)
MRPMAYYSHAQRPQPLGNFVLRFSGPQEAVVPQVREAMRQVARDLPVDEVVSLS